MNDQAVIRFAPSPNGELHLGHAYSGLLAHRIALDMGARFLLRIEDIDIGRCRPEFEAQILDDLSWLGLLWEEPVRRQSEHFDTYRDALARLDEMGLLYPCFASRSEIADAANAKGRPGPTDPDGAPLYPGLHRDLNSATLQQFKAEGKPFAMRINMARALEHAREKAGGEITFGAFTPGTPGVERIAIDPARWGDAVIARKDVPASYHLAVVVDDALQEISHVVRGLDLLASTDIHRLLQVLLDFPEPLYHHHRLIVDETGRKLSKRNHDKSLRAFREKGASPGEIAALLGLAD
jgi:glutamyl-Q tRNA(Asp) synthetase